MDLTIPLKEYLTQNNETPQSNQLNDLVVQAARFYLGTTGGTFNDLVIKACNTYTARNDESFNTALLNALQKYVDNYTTTSFQDLLNEASSRPVQGVAGPYPAPPGYRWEQVTYGGEAVTSGGEPVVHLERIAA